MHTRTLLISPWYVPIKVLRWQDAVKMRYEGTADVVVEYDDEIASPSVTWKMPAVLRLRRMPRAQKRGIRFSRLNVYQRDGYRCQYCGNQFPVDLLSYDHVVPRAAGGQTTWTNIVTACKACNCRKANHSCDDAGMWPLTTPRCPRSLPMQTPIIDLRTAPEEWLGFVRDLA
jgi:5-methylcytosine-specific restriction endonuclease McrA